MALSWGQLSWVKAAPRSLAPYGVRRYAQYAATSNAAPHPINIHSVIVSLAALPVVRFRGRFFENRQPSDFV